MKNWRAVLVAILIAAALSIFLFRHREVSPGSESWYAESPPGYFVENGAEAVQFSEVSESAIPTAIARLELKAIVPLEVSEVAKFTNVSSYIDAEKKPFLVRGIAANMGTGKFMVVSKDGNLRVLHGSLGTGIYKILRRPLIVWLANEPKKVFVDLEVAE